MPLPRPTWARSFSHKFGYLYRSEDLEAFPAQSHSEAKVADPHLTGHGLGKALMDWAQDAALPAIGPENPVLAARVHGFFELTDNVVRQVGVETVSGTRGSFHGWRRGGKGHGRIAATGRRGDAHLPEHRSATLGKAGSHSAFGGLGAASGLDSGGMRHSPEARHMLNQTMGEVVHVAEARQMGLPPDCAARTQAFVAAFPSDATTSMHRDLAARRPSENASLIGAVIGLARGDAGCRSRP